MENKINLFDAEGNLTVNVDGLAIREDQYIPQSFLDDLKNAREESVKERAREFHHVASIPVSVVNKWMREGFDIYEATIPEIMTRLRAEHLDGFIATKKRI